MAEFQLGSISTGTLRPEDLLPRFMGALEELTGTIEERYDEDNMDELIDDLNNACPPFVYFGTLEGDGADFGFWVEQNAIDDFISEAIEADLITLTNTGDEYANGTYIVHLAHDTENVTVMDMERNVLWSVV